MVFRIAAFSPDDHITGVMLPGPARLFGPQAVTYAVRPRPGGSRIVVRLVASVDNRVRRAAAPVMAAGDLVMMRKQLRTLADLAAREQRAAGSARG